MSNSQARKSVAQIVIRKSGAVNCVTVGDAVVDISNPKDRDRASSMIIAHLQERGMFTKKSGQTSDRMGDLS
jgi:hypothetical protein